MEFLLHALRDEIAVGGGKVSIRITMIMDKISALHSRELKDLAFEVSLYRKEAIRLRGENDALHEEIGKLQQQQEQAFQQAPAIVNSTPERTITQNTPSPSSSSSKNSQNVAQTPAARLIRKILATPASLPPAEPVPEEQPYQPTVTSSSLSLSSSSSTPSPPSSPVANEGGLVCIPLDKPPRKFQGDVQSELETEVPCFRDIINYPQTATDASYVVKGRRQCPMCGKECPFQSKSSSVKGATEPIIPTQNKGVCTACDVKVWVHAGSNLHIKWCKGCKNFQSWAAFGEKGWATKCAACRKRMADSYAAQKERKRPRNSF